MRSRASWLVIVVVAFPAAAGAASVVGQERTVHVVRTIETIAYTCLTELTLPGCPVVLDTRVSEQDATAPDAGPFDASVSVAGASATQTSSLAAPLSLEGTADTSSTLRELCVFSEPGCEAAIQVVEVDRSEAESRIELQLLLDQASVLHFSGTIRALAPPVPALEDARVEIEVLDAGGAVVWSHGVAEQAGDSGVVPVDASVARPAGLHGVRVVASSLARAGQLRIGPIPATAESEYVLAVGLPPTALTPRLPASWTPGLAALLGLASVRALRSAKPPRGTR